MDEGNESARIDDPGESCTAPFCDLVFDTEADLRIHEEFEHPERREDEERM